jgi:hypothetical protein
LFLLIRHKSFSYLSSSFSSWPFLLFLSLILRGKEKKNKIILILLYLFLLLILISPFLGETQKQQKKEPWIQYLSPTMLFLGSKIRSQWLTLFWLRLFRTLVIVLQVSIFLKILSLNIYFLIFHCGFLIFWLVMCWFFMGLLQNCSFSSI